VLPVGTEQQSESSGNTPVPSMGGAESGAVDPELSILLDLWPRLPLLIRALIVEVARGAIPTHRL